MNKVTISWYQTNWTQIREHEDTAFYAFTRGRNLIYIGIAYHQDVIDEIRSTLRRLQLTTTGMSIWLGYIERDKTSYGRITERIVREVESLMIYMNQPVKNQQSTVNYNGRWGLRVVCRNLDLIKHRISCDTKGILRNT